MLVQVDHLALTGTKVEIQSHLIESLGYEQVFFSENIPNPVNKQTLMNRWCDYHTLALYHREGSIPIEIIDYGHSSSGLSRYGLQTEFSRDLIHPDGSEVTSISSDFDSLNRVTLKTPDPPATCDFLKELGLESNTSLTLKFRSPLNESSIFVELIKDPLVEHVPSLDSTGFPCIAFVTTNIDEELSRLRNAGYEVTSVETINLPKRRMKVGFILGPTGTPIELVSPSE